VDVEYEVSNEFSNSKRPCTLLVIPLHCESNHVLSYSEYIEHVGNQPQAEETMYLVTGCRITNRSVPAPEVSENVGQKRTAAEDVTDEAVKKATIGWFYFDVQIYCKFL